MLGLHYHMSFFLVARDGLWSPRASVIVALWAPCLWSTHSVVVAVGLAASWHVESSWLRDGTCVSYIGRQILYH